MIGVGMALSKEKRIILRGSLALVAALIAAPAFAQMAVDQLAKPPAPQAPPAPGRSLAE
jgi:hypothetical protein